MVLTYILSDICCKPVSQANPRNGPGTRDAPIELPPSDDEIEWGQAKFARKRRRVRVVPSGGPQSVKRKGEQIMRNGEVSGADGTPGASTSRAIPSVSLVVTSSLGVSDCCLIMPTQMSSSSLRSTPSSASQATRKRKLEHDAYPPSRSRKRAVPAVAASNSGQHPRSAISTAGRGIVKRAADDMDVDDEIMIIDGPVRVLDLCSDCALLVPLPQPSSLTASSSLLTPAATEEPPSPSSEKDDDEPWWFMPGLKPAEPGLFDEVDYTRLEGLIQIAPPQPLVDAKAVTAESVSYDLFNIFFLQMSLSHCSHADRYMIFTNYYSSREPAVVEVDSPMQRSARTSPLSSDLTSWNHPEVSSLLCGRSHADHGTVINSIAQSMNGVIVAVASAVKGDISREEASEFVPCSSMSHHRLRFRSSG